MKELGTGSRILFFGAKLTDALWAEAINHGNWVRNRLPSSSVNNNIPIFLWGASATLSFSDLPTFVKKGFSFLYQSETRLNKNL